MPAFDKTVYTELAREIDPSMLTTEFPDTPSYWIERLASHTSLLRLNAIIEANGIPRINLNGKAEKIKSILNFLLEQKE